jgi:arginase
MGEVGLEERDGIEAKTIVLDQLHAALRILADHQPTHITTLGGECSVSAAPFSYLTDRYGDELAVVWGRLTPRHGYRRDRVRGDHAMVVSALTGHGDQEVLDLLPATTTADRVALVGCTTGPTRRCRPSPRSGA